MPIGVTSAGSTARMNRGTESHFVRMSDDPTAEIILPPGNDGYVAPDGSTGPHYDDQLSMFENFKYKDLLFGDDEIDAATESTQEIARQTDTVTPDDDTTSPDDSTATPDGSTPESPTPASEDDATTTTGDSVPGFTVLSGAAAVFGSAIVWLRKRGGEE
jgi:penicillin amidase